MTDKMNNEEYLMMMGDTIAITIGSYFRTLKEHMPEDEAKEFLADFLYLLADAMSGKRTEHLGIVQTDEQLNEELFGLKIPKVNR